jgi:hypothetical protein
MEYKRKVSHSITIHIFNCIQSHSGSIQSYKCIRVLVRVLDLSSLYLSSHVLVQQAAPATHMLYDKKIGPALTCPLRFQPSSKTFVGIISSSSLYYFRRVMHFELSTSPPSIPNSMKVPYFQVTSFQRFNLERLENDELVWKKNVSLIV